MADTTIVSTPPPDAAPTPARGTAASGDAHAGAAPWLLWAPALLMFAAMLLVPLALTALLSFHVFDGMRGVRPDLTIANYLEVLGDSYYHDIFLRTAGLALAVTLLTIVLG